MLLADDAKVLARAVSALRAEADSLREALDEKSEQLRRVGQSRQIFSGIEDVPSNGALLALGGKAAPRTHGSGDVRSINVDANSLPAKFDGTLQCRVLPSMCRTKHAYMPVCVCGCACVCVCVLALIALAYCSRGTRSTSRSGQPRWRWPVDGFGAEFRGTHSKSFG